MRENELVLKSVNELLEETFYVPSYQRGYRWTESQVIALLDDIWKFRADSQDNNREVFYCLQPVVVAPGEQGWIVIDGQQRLTTIHLILSYLNDVLVILGKQKFSINYETRNDSQVFLNEIDLEKEQENIDYFYMCQAYKTIEQWFSQIGGNAKINFLTTLLNSNEEGKNVKVIWYEVGETAPEKQIDIFTRLNIGKIPLTNAELIKALFLKKGNFREDKASLKQLQIATEWDAIEKKLQEDTFWYFIYNPKNPLTYDSRIEYLFDLIKGKKSYHEAYYTFNEFLQDFSTAEANGDKPDIDRFWLSIKRYFLTFEEWYNNKVLYHYIGFLVDCRHNINALKEEAENHSKTEFVATLKQKIRQEVACDIHELDYTRNRDKVLIKKILLLFNLETILSTKNTDTRFPFHRYKETPWDIEHVRSQADKDLTGNARIPWMMDILEYFTGVKGYTSDAEKEKQQETVIGLAELEQTFCERLFSLLNSEEIESAEFDGLYTDIQSHFGEDQEPEGMHGISNLALLDPATNRSYKNAMFPIKRSIILTNDMNGVFVPLCTKNVFLKSYSRKMGEIMYWKAEDAKDYLQAITKVLNEYLPQIEAHDKS